MTRPAAWCQRWGPGRAQSWRHVHEGGFDARRYGAAAIGEAEARAFILALHYSGTYPAARLRYGMFDLAGDTPALAGAAVLSVPASRGVLTAVFPALEPYTQALELGRFVLMDAVPANAESWFIGQVCRLAAAAGLQGIVSFSDPVARARADGTVVFPGHIGTIYQAANAQAAGRSTPRTLTVLRDGTVLSDRAASKIRSQDQGHDYAERQLTALGARPRRAGEPPAAWLDRALADTGARKIRHPGCHRYCFRLGATRRARSAVTIALPRTPYPKQAGDPSC
jgi:hypothetical protein